MRALIVSSVFAAAACTSQGSPTPTTTATQEAASTRLAPGCADTGPQVWDDGFVPQQTGLLVATFEMASVDPYGSPVDAVVGFASGSADAFTDLGPIVRLAPDGFVDARNGGAYQRDAAFDYTLYPYDPYVAIRMEIDLASHTYSVWANHDGHDDTVQLANNYAFRTEQSQLARVDTVDRFVDEQNDVGTLRLCDVAITPEHCTQSDTTHPAWASTAFPSQTGSFQVEVDAFEVGPRIDAVIGLAAAAPQAFTDLGPIVRFNPGGMLDVRDGGTYRSDTQVQYRENENYRVAFDVDLATHTYSVTVKANSLGATPVALATGYHFRTEQQDVTSLAALGQYVDQLDDPSSWFPDPTVDVCNPTFIY